VKMEFSPNNPADTSVNIVAFNIRPARKGSSRLVTKNKTERVEGPDFICGKSTGIYARAVRADEQRVARQSTEIIKVF